MADQRSSGKKTERKQKKSTSTSLPPPRSSSSPLEPPSAPPTNRSPPQNAASALTTAIGLGPLHHQTLSHGPPYSLLSTLSARNGDHITFEETVEDLQKMMRFLLSYEQSLQMWQKMIEFDNILGEEDAISSAMGKKAHPLVRKGAFEFLGRCIERSSVAVSLDDLIQKEGLSIHLPCNQIALGGAIAGCRITRNVI